MNIVPPPNASSQTKTEDAMLEASVYKRQLCRIVKIETSISNKHPLSNRRVSTEVKNGLPKLGLAGTEAQLMYNTTMCRSIKTF